MDLIDQHGRTVRDLRISVTDRCNFRCTYCMPAEGMTWLDRSEVLTFEEIERVSRICVERFGINSLRLTGGEPTVRAHLPRLISQLAALRLADGSKPDIALTTNGATLRNIAGELRDAGLDRINVSLDSLRAERFLAMTRRDELANVLAGIAEAKEAGFDLIKVNAVVERGANDDEILDMARYGRDNGVEVRFIEFMPLDASNIWERNKVVTQDEIVAAISAEFPLEIMPARGAAPADRWRYLDGKGTVGVIPSVSKPFCADCDRVRLTSDGQFRTCLFATDEFDLRALLRNGGSDDDIAELIARRGHEVGRSSDQSGELHSSQPLDEPDWWLIMSADVTGELANLNVLVEIDGPVATLTLNRPAKRNAVQMAMWASIDAHVTALTAHPDVRVLVVRGAGEHFCAGADISELTNGPSGEYARINWAAEEALANFPYPTIAMIRGNCVGGGVSIASACDIRISADDAIFGITPSKLGIVYPTNALERAVRILGASATKHLMYTGELINADRALRIGLIDELLSVDALEARVNELVATILERSSLTQVASKAMIDEVIRDGKVKPATTRHWEDEMDKSGEVREGVAAFLAKRPVRWPWKRN